MHSRSLSHTQQHIRQAADKLQVKETNPMVEVGHRFVCQEPRSGRTSRGGGGEGAKVVVSWWCVVAAGGQEQCLGGLIVHLCVWNKRSLMAEILQKD